MGGAAMTRLLKLLLTVTTSWLAISGAAQADPISIGFALFAGPLGSVFSFGALVTAAQVVVAAIPSALSLGIQLLNRPKAQDPGAFKQTFQIGEAEEIRAVGRVRIGGVLAFANSTGSGSDDYRLYLHCRGRISAVEKYWLGGREVTVDASGAVSSPPWSTATTTYATIKEKAGDGTETAWSDLLSTFPSLWTSNHRVRGIAQSLVKFHSPGITSDKFLSLYQSGFPDLEKLIRAEVIYDPRDAGQDVDDPGTWDWTDNGILVAAHVARAYPSFTSANFDWDDIAIEADKADALVATLTGTEKRARASGIWTSERGRGDVLAEVLRSIGADLVVTGDNLVTVRLIDDERAAEIAFAERHVVELELKAGPDSVQRPNVARVRYYAPERNYEMAEIDLAGIAWARVQNEIDRIGEQILDIDLPFCPSASQAQRLARRLFALARADGGVAVTNIAGLAAWGLRMAEFPLPDLGQTIVAAIGTPRADDLGGTVEIPFAVWPDLPAWTPAGDEAAAPEQLPELNYEATLDTPAVPSGYAIVQLYVSATWQTRIAFAEVSGGVTAEAVLRQWTGDLPSAAVAMTETEVATSVWWATLDGDRRGQHVDFRARFFDASDEASYFSEALNVPNLQVIDAVPSAPVITASAKILDGLGTAVGARVTFRVGSINTARVRCAAVGTGTSTSTDVDGLVSTQTFNHNHNDYPVTFTLTPYSTDGTAGPDATVIVS